MKTTAQIPNATKTAKCLFINDTDEEIDTAQVEEEELIEYMKRSTKDAEDKMRAANIPCWIETQRTPHSESRWAKKTATWNPGLNIEAEASRRLGGPKKRWEDDINQFLKPEETVETRGNDLKNNDTSIKAAKDQKKRLKEVEREKVKRKQS